jgi:catechol 2,3-dioxygenase-like lactoylglutathione lyase family enzyme
MPARDRDARTRGRVQSSALRGANRPAKMRPIMRGTISLVVQVVIVIGAVAGAAGAMPSPDGKPEAQSPLATARPYLVSLSVANLDLSVRWYREMLGFRETRRLNMPGSLLRISFLELNGFRLELIEFKDSVSLAAIRSKFPIVDDRARLQGFGKLAFAVASVSEVAASLKSKKVKFVREVTQEKDTGEIWFIIEDMNGNWLQFFEVRT